VLPFVFADTTQMGIVQPFGLLVAIGMALTDWLCVRRVALVGLSPAGYRSLRVWVLGLGFLISHLLDELVCHPEAIVANPLSLLNIPNGLSSVGGFIGALAGGIAWKYITFERRGFLFWPVLRKLPLPVLPYADVALACFPIGWVFGRAGCAIVHDHQGALAAKGALLAVAWPTSENDGVHHVLGPLHVVWGSVPRYDLGLLEMLFTIVLATAFVATWRRPMLLGTYVVVASLAYAPVRFAMDFLRLDDEAHTDPRLLGLTFAQWCSIALFVFGLAMLVHVRSRRTGARTAAIGFGAEHVLGLE
jgi:phosphatidylglycerol---prolipoprotein diacylglyceryl transferase